MSRGFTVAIRGGALKQLTAIPKTVQQRLEIKIDQLAANAYPQGCKKLTGETDLWRIRVGDYRVIYLVDSRARIIEIRAIGHRQSIYQ